MAIGDIINDALFGGPKFFLRDFRNAAHLRPDVNPPRQQHQGYVNFILNRDLYDFLYDEAQNSEFRTTISSMVRTAELPSAEFQTETKNAFNRKKIVNTGVSYNPVNITVFDTVGNEWLQTLMKYFAYHYMDPRNKVREDNRDIEGERSGVGGIETINSNFGTTDVWDSNLSGYNPNITPNFFERIDYVLFHGNRGVQYSIINPVITEFKPGSIDYASSQFLEFSITLEYERFTVYNNLNFELTDEDVDRFEQPAENIVGPAFKKADLPLVMESGVIRPLPEDQEGTTEETDGRVLSSLGTVKNPRGRSSQHLYAPASKSEESSGEGNGNSNAEIDNEGNASETEPTPNSGAQPSPKSVEEMAANEGPATYGNSATYAEPSEGGSGNWFVDVLSDTAEAALGAALTGKDVKDVALGTLAGGITTQLGNTIRQEREQIDSSAPNKGNSEEEDNT